MNQPPAPAPSPHTRTHARTHAYTHAHTHTRTHARLCRFPWCKFSPHGHVQAAVGFTTDPRNSSALNHGLLEGASWAQGLWGLQTPRKWSPLLGFDSAAAAPFELAPLRLCFVPSVLLQSLGSPPAAGAGGMEPPIQRAQGPQTHRRKSPESCTGSPPISSVLGGALQPWPGQVALGKAWSLGWALARAIPSGAGSRL